MKRDLLLFQF